MKILSTMYFSHDNFIIFSQKQVFINSQQLFNKMDELVSLIQERFRRVYQVLNNQLNSQKMRFLKQQQKQRCEKQGWILSMIKVNKSVTINAKINYFVSSYKIMKLIDPHFTYNWDENNFEQNFLNDFVCLYKNFFDKYQAQLNFKVKIKNLLRPTNHNIINDLIKYLSDFSRDYYQHAYLFKIKSFQSKEQTFEKKLERKKQTEFDISLSVKQNNTEKKLSCPDYKTHSLQFRKFSKKKDQQIEENKLDFIKNYEILDLIGMPACTAIEKSKHNLEQFKNKLNETYREIKYRNAQTRLSYSNYLSNYPKKAKVNISIAKQIFDTNSSSLQITYPFKLSLHIEKNGFSYINVNVARELTTREDRSFLKTRQNSYRYNQSEFTTKNQYLLNSLRVLRVSDNFFPLFNATSQVIPSKKQSNLPKIVPSQPSQKFIPYQQQITERQKKIETVPQSFTEKQKEQQSKNFTNKLFNIRKHYSSEQKSLKKNKKTEQPEQKIIKWLDKIQYIKNLERRKIMGVY